MLFCFSFLLSFCYIIVYNYYIIVIFIYTLCFNLVKLDIKKRQYLFNMVSELVATLNNKEALALFNAILKNKQECIPISVFKADISGLEIIVKYLKDAESLSFKNIAKTLNRRLSTIYNTYNNAKIKFKGKLDTSNKAICIPFNIFSDRKYSILEAIVAYLANKEKLSAGDISKLLNKNHSTIRTVYRRYKKKRQVNGKKHAE